MGQSASQHTLSMDKYSYINDPSRKRLVRVVAAGAGAGALFGFLYLWQIDFSLRGLLGSTISGATAGVVFFALTMLRAESRGLLIVSVPVAGASGGVAWWVIVQPDTGLWWCALMGAAVTTAIALLGALGLSL